MSETRGSIKFGQELPIAYISAFKMMHYFIARDGVDTGASMLHRIPIYVWGERERELERRVVFV